MRPRPATSPAQDPGPRPLSAASRALLAAPVVALPAAIRLYVDHGYTLPVCPIKALTGLDCPGCGSARATLALTRLDLPAALDFNLLLPLWLSLLAWSLLAWILSPVHPLRNPLKHRYAMGLYITITAAFWVLRLVPNPLRDYLASAPA